MESLPREVLCDLLRDYGRDLMTDSRLKNLLMDYCGSCRAEIHVLVQAQQAGIPERLWRDSQRLPVGVVIAQLSMQLRTDYFVAEEAARWAVETWALALGLELPATAPLVAPVPKPPIETVSDQVSVVRTEHLMPSNWQPALSIQHPVSSVTGLLFEPEMILIPAGKFLMGSDPEKDEDAYDIEKPQCELYLPDYYIAKTPVTNAQYAAFLKATRRRAPKHWKLGQIPRGKDTHPIVFIFWDDAIAYCKWLAQATGKSYTLPSEAEWEKAARGTDGRIYPWGDTFDKNKCNVIESGIEDTTPVDKYPQGASPYGVLDMAGNVYEWTRSLWGKDWNQPDFTYPYRVEDGRENLEVEALRVLRGGSWNSIGPAAARCAYRDRALPWPLARRHGFRVARGSL